MKQIFVWYYKYEVISIVLNNNNKKIATSW